MNEDTTNPGYRPMDDLSGMYRGHEGRGDQDGLTWAVWRTPPHPPAGTRGGSRPRAEAGPGPGREAGVVAKRAGGRSAGGDRRRSR